MTKLVATQAVLYRTEPYIFNPRMRTYMVRFYYESDDGTRQGSYQYDTPVHAKDELDALIVFNRENNKESNKC